MEKPAKTDHPVDSLIERRWSPRVFSDREVGTDAILSLLEAARWAASAYNAQPWSFIVARRQDKDEFERLLGCLVPGNQEWAKGAHVLMLTVAKLTFSHNDKPNALAIHDVGQAAATMAIQATSMGLRIHQMSGFDAAKARETYAIPDGYEPVTVIAVGYRADEDSMPEDVREKESAPRQRRPLGEIVFSGTWGNSSPILSG